MTFHPNQYDYAAASGSVPPQLGKCERCNRFTELDEVVLEDKVAKLCAACRDRLRGAPKRREPLPEMPW